MLPTTDQLARHLRAIAERHCDPQAACAADLLDLGTAAERRSAVQAAQARYGDSIINQSYIRDQIVCGDARDMAASIPDASVDLIFTDPVYTNLEDYQWLAREAMRVLSPGGAVLVWQQVSLLHTTIAVMEPPLYYRHTLIMTRSNVARLSCREYWFSHWTPCIWLSVTPDSAPVQRFRDAIDAPFVTNPNLNHKWTKPDKPLLAWIQAFTHPGGVVWDPFIGGGSIPACCIRLARHFYASEIHAETAMLAQDRLRTTPRPLPVLYQQQDMDEPTGLLDKRI